jgi:hypothetical protein
MANVNVFPWQVSGDIGGLGITRFWVQNAANTPLSSAECDVAGAAQSGFWQALQAITPSAVTWSAAGQLQSYDVATGAVVSVQFYGTVPTARPGGDGSKYVAGTGARINLKTNTVVNRRFVRGAIFAVPLASTVFNAANGELASSEQATILAAYVAYATALAAGSLKDVVWHRPTKALPASGVAEQVAAFDVPSQPAGLRSRRS